jgi:hypothetical protein
MRLTLDPFRTSLLAALGLLACNPKPGEDTSDTQADTTADTSASGGTTAGGTDTDPVTTGPGSASETSASASSSETSASASSDPTDTSATDETGSASDTAMTTAGTETGEPFKCDGAVEQFPQANTDPPVNSGFESCDGGIIHRAEVVECSTPATPTTCVDSSGGGSCVEDADCTDKPFGSCHQDIVFGGVILEGGTCSCVYGCASDNDCADGEVCRCGGDSLGQFTQCIAAQCAHDSDCPAGEICGLSPDICAPGGFLLACTTPNDLCPASEQCDISQCMFETDHWQCSGAACGRPFLVESAAVTAPAVARDDWRGLVMVGASAVDAETARRLADHWTRIGQLEHASVAAFAQFILQLLAVGAGPELVLAAQQALADEVEHAKLMFALASLYSGTGVGPGPLAIGGAAPAVELGALVDAVIREACLGETLAAFEAREAAAQAEDPGVRAALRRVAEDEQRHAELGWRFVQWALATDASLQGRARATFAAAQAEARTGVTRDAADAGTPELRAHGVIDAPLRAEVWQRGLAEVIEPCAAALFAGRRAA